MNFVEKLMLVVFFVTMGLIIYFAYVDCIKTNRWNSYATEQSCSYLGRANVDHKLMIQCSDGFIRLEDTRTYEGKMMNEQYEYN